MATYPDGTLIKASGPEVDRMEGGKRRRIPDPPTFNCMGLDWGAIITLSDSEWKKILQGPPYPSRAAGTLLQGSGPQVYVMSACQRHLFPDPSTFNAHGYDWGAIQHVSDADLSAIAEGAPIRGVGVIGNFPDHPKWRFTFVNHATTNPFFLPTQYGAQDACALFNCEDQWTGSQKADVVEMTNAISAAVAAKVDGIAVSVVDTRAFRDPIDRALQAGIPVVSYNADGAVGDHGSARLAYIGQDLFRSGVELGKKMVDLVGQGDIVGFIATAGALNLQPRIDGAKQAIQESGKPIAFTQIATEADLPQELSRIEAYYLGHTNLKGMFA